MTSITSDIVDQKPRLYYIDNLRVLACFLVLLTHSTMHTDQPEIDGFWMFSISFLGTPSSELFLALSGTVLLPVKTGFRTFYHRRFKKLLPPLFIWSILGMLLYTYTRALPIDSAINAILRIPFQPAIGVYWFVYAMAGLYLFAPYISPWLRQASRRQIEFFIGLWLINLTLPWILHFFPHFIGIFSAGGNYYWTLVYFGGFLGYWLMGYYLNKYPIAIGLNARWIALVSLFIMYPLAILILKLRDDDVSPLLDDLQLGSAVFVAMLYTLVQKVSVRPWLQKMITAVAKYSFGIYLTHIYIARELYWGLFDGSTIHIFPRTVLIAVLTLFTGYLLTWLLSRLPHGKYITGA